MIDNKMFSFMKEFKLKKSLYSDVVGEGINVQDHVQNQYSMGTESSRPEDRSNIENERGEENSRGHGSQKKRSVTGTGQGDKISIRGVKLLGQMHVCKLDPNLTEDQIS
ncbi:hypothetical protein HHI36_000167 [Cryptolaemus montrouzieri]|uniref:Uncharacterized protein n=1 Tax=Cryptolaemus montrouzieri TaxID=559131 RepID=A0ABD2P4Y7_9CUCU